MAFVAGATFAHVSGCEVTLMEDGIVVYHGPSEAVHYLNPTAGLIFDLCGERRSLREIADYLHEHFALPAPPEAEVDACIEQLLGAGLITPR